MWIANKDGITVKVGALLKINFVSTPSYQKLCLILCFSILALGSSETQVQDASEWMTQNGGRQN